MNRSTLLSLGATLLLLSAAGIAAWRFGALHFSPEGDPQPLAPTPPLLPADAWGQMEQSGVPPEMHQALQAHRGLAQAIASYPAEDAGLDALLALAPFALDHRLREELTVSLQLSPVELSVLVGNPLGRSLLRSCPSPRLDPVCDSAWRKGAMKALAARLVDLLGSEDDVIASRSLDLVCQMGPPAQPIAEAALRSESLRSRATGLIAAGCVFEADRARKLMSQHLDPSDPLAPVAVLELGRLGSSDSELSQLQASQGVLSLFATYGLSSSSSNTQERSSPK